MRSSVNCIASHSNNFGKGGGGGGTEGEEAGLCVGGGGEGLRSKVLCTKKWAKHSPSFYEKFDFPPEESFVRPGAGGGGGDPAPSIFHVLKQAWEGGGAHYKKLLIQACPRPLGLIMGNVVLRRSRSHDFHLGSCHRCGVPLRCLGCAGQ